MRHPFFDGAQVAIASFILLFVKCEFLYKLRFRKDGWVLHQVKTEVWLINRECDKSTDFNVPPGEYFLLSSSGGRTMYAYDTFSIIPKPGDSVRIASIVKKRSSRGRVKFSGLENVAIVPITTKPSHV
jgi:hypothetical protein